MNRLKEYCDTVTAEASQKYNRDSEILSAASQIITSQDDYSVNGFINVLQKFQPIVDTMKIRAILPDNTIISSNGHVIDNSQTNLDFDEILRLGEHTSERLNSILTDEYIIRHYLPVYKNNRVIAIIYGTTELDELEDKLNISNYYENQSDIYVFDYRNGEEILNTSIDNRELGCFYDRYNFSDNDINIIKNENKGHILYEKDGDKSYFYFQKMYMNNWEVAIRVPYSYAMKNMKDVTNVCIMFYVGVMILLILFYIWIYINAKEKADMNILKEKAELARKSENAKTVFFNNLSHDIRTPLNAINGFTQMALRDINNQSKVKEYLEKVDISNKYLLNLINDILDIGNIDDKDIILNEQNYDIYEIVKEITTVFESYIINKNMGFVYDYKELTHEYLFFDKLKFYKILINLLSNATKYTREKGIIYFNSKVLFDSKENKKIRFTISDNGIGMEPEFIDKLFLPYAVENKNSSESHGLGMSIVKNLIDKMQGTIYVESQKNKGTTYILEFNFSKKLISYNKNEKYEDDINKYNYKILLVEDNELNAEIQKDMLEDLGCQVIACNDSFDALKLIKDNQFDLVITDINLPGMDGFKLIEEIRNVKNISMVALTANCSESDRLKAISAGFKDYLIKPVNKTDLIKMFQSLEINTD